MKCPYCNEPLRTSSDNDAWQHCGDYHWHGKYQAIYWYSPSADKWEVGIWLPPPPGCIFLPNHGEVLDEERIESLLLLQ